MDKKEFEREVLTNARFLLRGFHTILTLRQHFAGAIWIGVTLRNGEELMPETYTGPRKKKLGKPTGSFGFRGTRYVYWITGLPGEAAWIFGLALSRSLKDQTVRTTRNVLSQMSPEFNIPEVKKLLKLD